MNNKVHLAEPQWHKQRNFCLGWFMLLNSNYCIHIHFQYIDGSLVFVCVILTKNIYGGSPVSKIICEFFERYHIKKFHVYDIFGKRMGGRTLLLFIRCDTYIKKHMKHKYFLTEALLKHIISHQLSWSVCCDTLTSLLVFHSSSCLSWFAPDLSTCPRAALFPWHKP